MADVVTVFDKNELILDKIRSLTAHDITTGEMFMRLTSLEDPSLATSSESEEVTAADGALISTLYRAKRGTFSANNSLVSVNLLAAQYGTKKQVAGKTMDEEGKTAKVIVPTYEILTVAEGETTKTLKHTPVNSIIQKNGEDFAIDYIYSIVEGEVGTTYKAAAVASATEFVITDNVITVPTDFTGKLYVEYDFESENNAMKVVNSTENFPESCMLKIYAYFRDKCNDNLIYSGVILAQKAKLNPESSELTLTSTGKHPFEFQFQKDYCSETSELFSIIIFGGQE